MKRKNITVKSCAFCPFLDGDLSRCMLSIHLGADSTLSGINGVSDYAWEQSDRKMPKECPLLKHDGVSFFGVVE